MFKISATDSPVRMGANVVVGHQSPQQNKALGSSQFLASSSLNTLDSGEKIIIG